MLVRVLATPDVPYLQAAELLAKVGDEASRDKGAAALIARVPKTQDHGEATRTWSTRRWGRWAGRRR